MWDYSILSGNGNYIISEGFDYESEEEAEAAAMRYIKDNEICERRINL